LLQSQVHRDALPISIKHVMLTYLMDPGLPQRLADGRTLEVKVAARNAALVAVDPRYPRRDRIKQFWGDDEPIEPVALTTTSVDQFYLTYKHFEGNDAQIAGLGERLAAYRAAALGLSELAWMEHSHGSINTLVRLAAETITAVIPVERGGSVRRLDPMTEPTTATNPADDPDPDLDDDARHQGALDCDIIDLLQADVNEHPQNYALPISTKQAIRTYLKDPRLPQRLADGRTRRAGIAARNAACLAADPRYPRRDRIVPVWHEVTTSADQFFLTYEHFDANDAQIDGLVKRLAAYRAAALGLAELNWMEHLHEPINALVRLTAETITAQIPTPRGERVRRFERRGHPTSELTDQNGCPA
jgi:hypothetical protein